MRTRMGVLPILLLIACDREPIAIIGPPVAERRAAMSARDKGEADTNPRDDVFIAHRSVTAADVLKHGKTARDERERVVAEIVGLYPELGADKDLIASLKGEAPWVVLSIPAKYEAAAALVSRAYQLVEIERRAHVKEKRQHPLR
jgi:hypothetical protein